MRGTPTDITEEPCPICGTLRRTIWLGRRSPYFDACPNDKDERHQAVYARWKREGAESRAARNATQKPPTSESSAP